MNKRIRKKHMKRKMMNLSKDHHSVHKDQWTVINKNRRRYDISVVDKAFREFEKIHSRELEKMRISR